MGESITGQDALRLPRWICFIDLYIRYRHLILWRFLVIFVGLMIEPFLCYTRHPTPFTPQLSTVTLTVLIVRYLILHPLQHHLYFITLHTTPLTQLPSPSKHSLFTYQPSPLYLSLRAGLSDDLESVIVSATPILIAFSYFDPILIAFFPILIPLCLLYPSRLTFFFNMSLHI